MLVALMWQGSGARKAGNYFAPRRRLEEYWDFYLVELSTKGMDFAVEYSTKGHVFAVEYSTKGTAFAVECSTKRHVSWFNSARSLLRFWLNVRPGDRFLSRPFNPWRPEFLDLGLSSNVRCIL